MAAEMLSLSMSSGSETKIELDATVGPFAIHRAVGSFVDAWTVTHIKTGKKIWTTQSLQHAIRAAQYLDQAKLIPEGAEEAEAWRAALSPQDKAHLLEQLQEIAPRAMPEGDGT